MPGRIFTSTLIVLGQVACGMASEATGAAAEDKGLFSGSLGESVWTVVAFGALVLVLGKFAWKPLLAGLKAREEHIQGQIDAATGARQKAEQALHDSKQQGMEIIQQAREDAVRRQAQIVEQTHKELTQLKEDAHGDIEHARHAAMEHLWQQSGMMVQAITQEVLGRGVTDQDNHRLILEAVNHIRQKTQEGKA
jgi:F-type H+-transporting ATPase subunit b